MFRSFTLDPILGARNPLTNKDHLPLSPANEAHLPSIAQIMHLTSLQQQYIDSLKLESTVESACRVLNSSLEAVAEFYGTKPKVRDIDSYMLLRDVILRKRALDAFAKEFGRLSTHVINLAKFLRAKEETYLR